MKIFLFRCFFLARALLCPELQGKEVGAPIVYTKQQVFEIFFRELLENTPAGYVLCGHKPVYLESCLPLEKTIPGSSSHRFSARTLFFLENWKEVAPVKSDADYLFVGKEDEFLLINRKEFIRTVKDHLSLFQYKLGVETSPESLLESLLDPKNSFSSLFQENIALQGILLGYGAKNSITYEKGSLLMKDIKSPTISVPYQTASSPKSELEMLQKLETRPEIKKRWNALKDEMKNFTFYKPLAKTDHLKIPFSFHPKTDESELLLSQYRVDQKNVESLLADRNFVKKVLSKFNLELKFSSDKKEIGFSPEEKAEIPKVIAASLRNSFKQEWSPSFVEGMKAVELDNLLPTLNEDIKFFEIRKNQMVSTVEMPIFSNAECIIPHKLYFQILKKGHSSQVLSRGHKRIKASYSIKDSLGNNLAEGASELDLNALIPGLAHGMLGMYEGEIRDILIHPDLAYGIDSDLFNGGPFRAQVELLSLGDLAEEKDSLTLKLPDVYAPNISSCADFLTLQNQYFHYCGASSWAHYKCASPFLTLDAILPALQNPGALSAKEKRLLLKLEWFLYSSD